MNITTSLGILIRTSIAICIGAPALLLACQLLKKTLKHRFSWHISTLISNIVLYIGCTFISISILHDFGFNLSAFLGAAGIIGIAVGFAAQTSVANIINGLFLILEQSCVIGDIIKHDELTGTIESIDLLSVKVRTLDNTLIRIPNEFFIKKIVINKTYFPTQVISFKVSVPINHDIHAITKIINDVIAEHATFLIHPAPRIHLFEVTSSYVPGQESLYFTNDIKVEIAVNKGKTMNGRDIFVSSLQKALSKEEIQATITRL